MAYIYVITNNLNNKQYVGKTNFSIEKRWKEHQRDSLKNRCEKRPLYNAINKYGVESFIIEELEKCSPDIAEQREQYWIEQLDTYKNGYNATLGGDGAKRLDYIQIINNYKELKNAAMVARINNCDVSTVLRILKDNDINVCSSDDVLKKIYSKRVKMLDKITKEVIAQFPSQVEAAKFLIANGYSKAANPFAISDKIGLVCRGKRKTANGFAWEYDD